MTCLRIASCLSWTKPPADQASVLQVVPTLLVMLHRGDTDAVPHLTALVGQLRQHLRRWLPDLVQLIHDLWPRPVSAGQQPSKLLLNLLDLLACLAGDAQSQLCCAVLQGESITLPHASMA